MRAVAQISVSFLALVAALLLASPAEAAAPKKKPAAAAVKAPPPPVEEKPAAPSAGPAGAPTDVAVGPRGPTRIDFDDRLIQGQTNKSGAVYLFDRKELSVRSMVRQRTSFRDQIVKDILTE